MKYTLCVTGIAGVMWKGKVLFFLFSFFFFFLPQIPILVPFSYMHSSSCRVLLYMYYLLIIFFFFSFFFFGI